MPALKLEQFGGELPAWDPHLLPTGQAQYTQNTYVFGGGLTGWRAPKVLRALQNSAAKFAYRVPTVSQAAAQGFVVFSAQPNSGDTLTVGEQTYRFVNVLSQPNDILIGANSGVTATNTLDAITCDQGNNTNQGIQYGQNTCPNAYVSLTAGVNFVASATINATSYPYVYLQAPDIGAAFNLQVFSSTGGRVLCLGQLNALTPVVTTFTGGQNATFNSSITGPSTWLEFLDPYTTVMKSQVVDDQFQRYYFAQTAVQPQYNTQARIQAGLPPFLLGVPPPGCAPEVTVTGGGNSGTFGTTTTDGNTDTLLANQIYVRKLTTTGVIQIQDVQWMPQTTDPNVHWAAVLYQDNGTGNQPGAILNVGAIEVGITAGTLALSAFTNPSGLLANDVYWVGIFLDTQENIAEGMSAVPAGGQIVTWSQPFGNGPSANAPTTPNSVPTDFYMYADYQTEDVQAARAYVYTWVSAYGEEGAPSPPTLANGWSNGIWTIQLFQPPLLDQGTNRNLTRLRIYRTVAGQSGATVYFFVAEVPITQGSYVDSSLDSVVALNIQLPSTNWFPPPEGLQSIQAMPNGMTVGFKGNEVWFSDPYIPHGWPPGYVLTTDFPIIGLGIWGTSVVVCTASKPYILTGSSPQTMASMRLESAQPCLSRGSILSDANNGVFYMSPNGLILVNPGTFTAVNTTELWITREQWQQITPQQYTFAIAMCSCYFCLGTTDGGLFPTLASAQQGFAIELDQDNMSFTIWPQPGGHRVGFNRLGSQTGAGIDNAFLDPWTGIGLLISGGNIYQYDFTDPAPTIQPYTWRSKIYQQNAKKDYSAMKCFFLVPPGTPPQNAVPNTAPTLDPSWNTLNIGQYGIVRVFADIAGNGSFTLVTTREIVTSGGLMRILSGFKAEQWYWELTARVNISNLQVATSAKELANV